MASPNPLAGTPSRRGQPQTPTMHPIKAHATVWRHVHSLPAGEQDAQLDKTNYALPILGRLASDPNVKPKDVIKAAADAAGAGKIDPSQAVELISQMPQDPDKLRPWLRGMYALQFTAAVHLNAAQMARTAPQGAQPAPAPAAPAPGMPA